MARIILMFTLVVAGELIFGLPFHIARFFKPTLLDVFGFSNTTLGDIQFFYGVVALLAYFPGSALADRYSARKLMAMSLFATAAGGLYMATIPAATGMAILYAYWGLTTIALFWGALIRATREWGGHDAQGLAFGIQEGGRGLAAAAFALLVVTIFGSLLPQEVSAATDAQREAAFRVVVLSYAAVTFAAGALTWFTIPETDVNADINALQGMRRVLGVPVVWAQGGIILCAYTGYRGLDNYSLYLTEVMQYNELAAAKLTAYAAYLRPVAAVLAGIAADRFSATRVVGLLFAAMVLLFVLWSQLAPADSGLMLIYINFFASFAAVFALRGVYFALLQENHTPRYLTGAAVGLVSLLGYTPDVFFAPIAGRILDANPGVIGFQNYFLFLAAVALLGLAIAVVSALLLRRGPAALWPLDRENPK